MDNQDVVALTVAITKVASAIKGVGLSLALIAVVLMFKKMA